MNRFELYWADVLYDGTTHTIKRRPVLILKDLGSSAICLKVTSHPPRATYNYEFSIQDWKQAGLTKPSTVRGTKRTQLKKSEIYSYIGKLSSRDILKLTASGMQLSSVKKSFKQILTEVTKEQETYRYEGPVYRFQDSVYRKRVVEETQAVSLPQAISRLKYKIKIKLGFSKNAYIAIDNDKVKKISTHYDYRPEDRRINYCPDCGYQLNDIGDCPVCDYGEYDLLD